MVRSQVTASTTRLRRSPVAVMAHHRSARTNPLIPAKNPKAANPNQTRKPQIPCCMCGALIPTTKPNTNPTKIALTEMIFQHADRRNPSVLDAFIIKDQSNVPDGQVPPLPLQILDHHSSMTILGRWFAAK